MLGAKVSAHCNRVAVEDGHTECVSVKFSRRATHQDILAAWSEFDPLHGQHLPTAPDNPVQFEAAHDRPQPRLDRMRGNGMAAIVGRLRECALLDWKFVVSVPQHDSRRSRGSGPERRSARATRQA